MKNTVVRTTIAKEINSIHSELINGAKTMLERAQRAGELLCQVKDSLDHGQFGAWLRENISFAETTARNYMRVWNNRERIKTASLADLNQAYELLKDAKDPVEQRETPPCPPPPPPSRNRFKDPDATMQARAGNGAPPHHPPPPPPQKIVDKIGREIPTECIQLWNRTPEAREFVGNLSALRNAVKDAQEGKDELFAEVNCSSTLAHLEQAYASLKSIIPYAVCPWCQGVTRDGCRPCHGRGLISEFAWKHTVPDDLKTLVESTIE